MEGQSKLSEETGLNGEQYEQQYNCEQFIQFIKRLSETSILYYCPYQEVLKDYYQQFLKQKNVKTMSEEAVIEFISTLRSRNREILATEVHFYQGELKQKLSTGITSASRKQFMKIVRKFDNGQKIISDILFEKVKMLEFVSCQRVMDFLEDIKLQIEGATQPTLSPQKLKDISISQRESEQFVNNEEDFNWIKDIKLKHWKYFEQWNRQMLYFTEYISDDGVKDQAQVFVENIKKVQRQLIDEIESLYDHGDKVQKQCMEFEQFIRELVEKNALNEEALEKYSNLLDEQKSQIRHLQKEKIQYLERSVALDEALQCTQGQLVQIQNQYQLIEEDYRMKEKKYMQIQVANEKLVQSLNVEEKLAQKKANEIIFKERSIKQQLDDTLHKFNRLLKERQVQKQNFKQNDDEKTNKIQILQLKIQQLEEELKSKNQNLNNYATNSKIINFQAFRNSMIRQSSIHGRSGIFDVRESFMAKSKLRPKKLEQQNEQLPEAPPLETKLSKKMESQLQNRPTSFSEIKKVDIGGVQLPQIVQEENISSIIDINNLPQGQELTKVMKSDDSSVGLEDTNKGFEKKKENYKVEKAESNMVSKLNASVICQKFIGKGVFINIHGIKYEVTILLNHKRFCYFDTKLRLVRYLPIQNIKSFVFCRQNPTMFIIRPKNRQQLDSKKHITNPMIISLRTRERLAHYLTNNIKKLVKDNRIQLSTRNQVDIFLKIDDQEINMKHKIANMTNPFRLALSHEPVYYAKLQEEGILSMKNNAVIIVQPVGLLCFTGEQTYQLQSKRELLYLLPFEDCNISERQNSTEAPGRKVKLIYQNESYEKYFNIIFNNPEDLKRFIKSCTEQIEKTKKLKMQISQSLDKKFKK